MATLTVQQITTAGIVPALVAASAGGDQFSNNGHTSLRVVNGGASPVNVTIVAQTPCNRGVIHSTLNSVAAGATEEMGPFDPAIYSDGAGNVQITYSAVTSVTVGAFSR